MITEAANLAETIGFLIAPFTSTLAQDASQRSVASSHLKISNSSLAMRRGNEGSSNHHHVAGSAGAMNLGVTSVAAPNAASSRTARYSSTARPAASGGRPAPP